MFRNHNRILGILGLVVVTALIGGVMAVRAIGDGAGGPVADAPSGSVASVVQRSDPSVPGSTLVPPDQVEIQPEVQAAFDAGLSAPVIVKLDVVPTGTDDERIEQVRDARERFLDGLPSESWTAAKDVGTLPYFAVTLDPAGIEATRMSGVVSLIAHDEQRLVPFGDKRVLADAAPVDPSSLAPTSLNSTATMGAVSAWAAGWNGAGATIAVIDTGVETSHPYLMRDGSPKTIAEACFATAFGFRSSPCPNGVSMQTTDAPRSGSATPCPGSIPGCTHGTHVAGIAVGGDGVAVPSGVAPEANLIAINAFTYTSTGASAATSDINNALQWLYYNRARFPGLTSVNMSLGGTGTYANYCDAESSVTKSYIDQLLSIGISTVIASGNSGSTNGVSSPGCISSAVTVGAVDGVPDATTSYSNDGMQVDLMAPGTSITSSVMGGQMGAMSGTSMATPAVAGAIATLRQETPAGTLSRLRDSGFVVNASGFLIPSVRLSQAASIYPGPPQSLSVATDVGSATVSWQPPSTSGSRAVDRYSVTTNDGLTCATTTSSCTITGLTTGATYSFVVRAESSVGLGASIRSRDTVVLASSAATTSSTTSTTLVQPPISYNAIPPARVSDTRSRLAGGSTVDDWQVGSGKLPGGTTEIVQIAGRGGVPSSGAVAVALNVTVVNASTDGHLTVYPSGSAKPTASNINFVAGSTVPNMVISKLGSDGSIAAFNSQGAIDVIVDVVGWFPISGGYGALEPARLVETRSVQGYTTIDGRMQGIGGLRGGQTLSVPVAGRGGIPTSGVSAVALNVTAVDVSAETYLTVFPGGTPRPNASNLNAPGGRTIANMVIAKVGVDGTISIFNNNGSANLVVDVVGWFGATSRLTPLSPARLVESRALPTIDGRQQGIGPISGANILTVEVAGRGGVPASGARAVALNVTVIGPTTAGHLTAFPSGGPVPNSSNLNFVPGQIVPNMVIAQLGSNGKISLYNSAGSTPVAVDVVGWFS